MDSGSPAWYAAFKSKDTRFDGRIFVGVSSTGIYCRPVCRAKLPKAENCTFYTTAAAAEQAGFRPCLICRPELAPGTAPMDAAASLARQAARMIEESCESEESLENLASRLGYTGRHLRRVFAREFGVTPVRYLQTCRLLLAKNLLTDTGLSVTDVAMAAGFGSLRRFNDLFKKQYRLAPTALRREAGTDKRLDNAVTLSLGYRPPFQWRQILDFLALRAIPGVEIVRDGEYWRTARLASGQAAGLNAGNAEPLCGWIRVGCRPEKNILTVSMDTGLLPVLPQVLARVRRLFDLHCEPHAVYETLSSMNAIRPGLSVLGTRLPGCFDPFEMAVRAILGQQITVKGARTLAGRVAQTYGTPIKTGIEGLTHTFPSPGDIVLLKGPIGDHLGPLGVTGTRAGTILALARAMDRGEINFGPGAEPGTEIKKLLALPGIGEWTAQYMAMRAMEWPDAFPHTDYGIKKALAPHTPKEILKIAEAWRPWRSYAAINLWNSL